MDNKEYKVIGKRIPLLDGIEKVTGQAIYGADVRLPGLLRAKILRSPYAHAHIKSIDTNRAMKIHGVRLIATGRNTPRTQYGASIQDERFFAFDEVYYIGDEVAAVVAIDEDIANEALGLIEVEYSPLPAVFDPLEALKPGCALVRSDMQSNICHHVEVIRGDIENGFRQADVIHEETYSLQHQYQAYLEPHVTTAQWQGGRLTLWAPHQGPRQLANVISRAFNISLDRIRFLQTCVGGGFGGKNNMRLCPLVALLSNMTGSPVQVIFSREEDFMSGMPSVPMIIHLRMGAKANGTITAKETAIVADNGAYTTSALGVLEVAATRTDPLYRIENLRLMGDLVYTNKLVTSAFRGFGSTQHHFALESMMDSLAEKLAMDPADIRLINAPQTGDVNVHGWRISSCGFSQTIKVATHEAGWSAKHNRQRGRSRGIGMACGINISGNANSYPAGYGSSALIRIHGDGMVQVCTGEGDIGQGAKTLFAQIAAEILMIPINQVVVDPLDTDVSYFGNGAVASHVTMMGGHAVREAAIAARQRLTEAAARKWGCEVGEVQLIEGKLVQQKQELSMEIAEAARAYINATGGSRLTGEGIFRASGVTSLDQQRYGNLSLGYSFATHVAEVEVDLETGRINILNIVAVHDSGQIINPLAAEGQVEGALLQGMGYALLEEYIFEDGRVLNPDFTNYRIPTALDAPEMRVLFIPTYEPNGPFGAKSLAECAMLPVAPAIANAIYDAIGIRFTQLPITPDKVLKRLKKEREIS